MIGCLFSFQLHIQTPAGIKLNISGNIYSDCIYFLLKTSPTPPFNPRLKLYLEPTRKPNVLNTVCHYHCHDLILPVSVNYRYRILKRYFAKLHLPADRGPNLETCPPQFPKLCILIDQSNDLIISTG